MLWGKLEGKGLLVLLCEKTTVSAPKATHNRVLFVVTHIYSVYTSSDDGELIESARHACV